MDEKPLKELYNEAKADVIEELEDLPEDNEVCSVELYFAISPPSARYGKSLTPSLLTVPSPKLIKFPKLQTV